MSTTERPTLQVHLLTVCPCVAGIENADRGFPRQTDPHRPPLLVHTRTLIGETSIALSKKASAGSRPYATRRCTTAWSSAGMCRA